MNDLSLAQVGEDLNAMQGWENADSLLCATGFPGIAIHRLADDMDDMRIDYHFMHKA